MSRSLLALKDYIENVVSYKKFDFLCNLLFIPNYIPLSAAQRKVAHPSSSINRYLENSDISNPALLIYKEEESSFSHYGQRTHVIERDQNNIVKRPFVADCRPPKKITHAGSSIYTIKDAILDSHSGLILSSEIEIIQDIDCSHDSCRIQEFTDIKTNTINRLVGTWLCLKHSNNSPSHFFMEVLKKIIFASQHLQFSGIQFHYS